MAAPGVAAHELESFSNACDGVSKRLRGWPAPTAAALLRGAR